MQSEMFKLSRLCGLVLLVAAATIPLEGCAKASEKSITDTRPHVVVVIGEDHFYGAIDSMWELAKALQTHHGMRVTVLQATSRTSIPGLEAMDDADLAVFFIRRRVLPEASMQHVHDYLDAGKPLIAFRTTSHGFAPLKQAFTVSKNTSAHKSDKQAEKAQTGAEMVPWPEFDREVLGGYYQGYYLGETLASVVPEQKDHPILKGVEGPYQLRETLYINLPLADTTKVLMMGKCVDGVDNDKRYRIEADKDHIDQPVAWINSYNGGRIFYTSMGNGKAAFAATWFRRMVINSVFWALEKPVHQVNDDAYINQMQTAVDH